MLRRPLLVIVLVMGAGLIAKYRRQIVSRLTHWKGSPTRTVPFVPLLPDVAPLLRVAVAGDVGHAGDRLDATGAAMARCGKTHPYEVLLLLGDNVYPNGDPAGLSGTVFRPFDRVLDQGAELLAILGNHDVKRGHGDAQLRALGMAGRWWARERGNVCLIGLDSNAVGDHEQLRWLEHALASTTARWKIVAVHHSPYSAGYQGSNHEVRDRFVPLFERFGVHLVLSAHDHDYQRSKALNGVTYIVTGGAAGTRRTGTADFTAESFSWHHFVDLTVLPERLVVRAVSTDLRVADEAVIEATPP